MWQAIACPSAGCCHGGGTVSHNGADAARAARGEAAAGAGRRGVAGQANAGGMPVARADDGHRGEQRLGVGMIRRMQHIRSGTLLDQRAAIHHRDPVGDVGDHADVVTDENMALRSGMRAGQPRKAASATNLAVDPGQ